MPDPLAQQRVATAQMAQASTFGRQPSGQLKGPGFLGMFKLPNGGVASEFSAADSEKLKDAKGNYLDYPTLIPTLTRDEVQAVLRSAVSRGHFEQEAATKGLSGKQADEYVNQRALQLPDSVYDKAEAWALNRQQQGKPLFAQPGEQYPLYPDIPRVSVQWPSGDISLPNESGQTDPRLGKLGYENVEQR